MTKKHLIVLALILVVLTINAYAPQLPAWMYLMAIGLALVAAGFAMASVKDMIEADRLRELFNEEDEHRDHFIG